MVLGAVWRVQGHKGLKGCCDGLKLDSSGKPKGQGDSWLVGPEAEKGTMAVECIDCALLEQTAQYCLIGLEVIKEVNSGASGSQRQETGRGSCGMLRREEGPWEQPERFIYSPTPYIYIYSRVSAIATGAGSSSDRSTP